MIIKSITLVENYDNLIFIDSAPFQFGILSGIMSTISVNSKKNLLIVICLQKNPAPSAVRLIKNYYIDYNLIIKKILSELKLKINFKYKKQSFDEKKILLATR